MQKELCTEQPTLKNGDLWMNEVAIKDQERLVLYDLATEQDYKILRDLSVGKKVVFEFGTFIGGSALAMVPHVV